MPNKSNKKMPHFLKLLPNLLDKYLPRIMPLYVITKLVIKKVVPATSIFVLSIAKPIPTEKLSILTLSAKKINVKIEKSDGSFSGCFKSTNKLSPRKIRIKPIIKSAFIIIICLIYDPKNAPNIGNKK